MRPAAIRLSIGLAAAGAACPAAIAATPASASSSNAPYVSTEVLRASPHGGTASSAIAPPQPLSDACPAQLPVSQTVAEPIAGWTPLNQQGNYPFARVAFYAGPPTDTPLIVPTVEYKGQAGLHDRWDLPTHAGGYWMTCAYGNTTATVTRKLSAEVDFCQADYDGRFMTLVVRHWSCGVKRTMPVAAWERPAAKTAKLAAKPAVKPAAKPAPPQRAN